MKTVISFLLNNKKTAFITLIGVIGGLLIWKNYPYIKGNIKRFFGQNSGDFTYGIGGTEGNPHPTNEAVIARKSYIRTLAENLYAAINETLYTITGKIQLLKEVNELNDAELLYLDDQYSDISPDEGLWTAIDEEILPMTTIDSEVQARLSRLNRKK